MSNGMEATRPNWASTRELMRLAWPLIIGSSVWTLQIVLDRVLLSGSGSETVGAALSAALLFWTPLMLFQYTANYATTFVAQYTGADQPRQAGAVVGQALWFSVISGLAFLLLIPLVGPVVSFIGHSPELQAQEATYLRCLCFSALPTLVVAAACSFFAGVGNSRTVLFVNVSGLLVNGLCAWVLIRGELGLPRLGIAGAGWATVLGTSTSALLSLCCLFRRRYRQSHSTVAGLRFDGALFRRLLRFGVPNGVFAALDTLAFTVFTQLVGLLGEVELAATSIAFTLNLLAFLPMMGVGQAVEVLVGQKLGENRPDEAARYTWTGLVVAMAFNVVVAAGYLGLPNTLAWLFHPDQDAANWVEVSARVPILLRFMTVYCLFDCANLVFSYALRGAGDTRFVTVVGVGLAWPVMVLPTWASWRYGWGLYWAWGFVSLYIILLALTFLARFIQGRWRTMRVIETPGADQGAFEGTEPERPIEMA